MEETSFRWCCTVLQIGLLLCALCLLWQLIVVGLGQRAFVELGQRAFVKVRQDRVLWGRQLLP